ncbi:MAG: PilZ domain-containing protein [Leptothrix ochracea]|uniref:PilZ domain-containing protein n=1 Tax=Leptothrix ochracea TaxID=735331 RepID=UPI0034E2D1F3
MSELTPPRPNLAAAGAAPPARSGLIQLNFKEKGALYAAYISFFEDGGIFFSTNRDYKLGEDVYLLMTLPDDPQRYTVHCRVAWLTPPNAPGGRTPGVGVRFSNDEKARILRIRIEELLGTAIQSGKPTQTI